MPFWFIALGVVSLLGVLTTIVGIVPLYTSMITMGLALPFWMVLVNLWWIWLLLLPIVRFHRNGRPILGWLLAGAMAALAVLMVQFAVNRNLASFALPPNVSSPAALAETPPRSAELDDLPQSSEEGICGRMCEGLLLAGMDWVRIIDRNQGAHQIYLIRRALPENCRGLDRDFPPTAPCLMAATDDGAPADLQVRYEYIATDRATQNSGFAALISTSRLVVEDARVGTILHDERANTWTEVNVPPFMTLDLQFDDIGGDGAVLHRETKNDPMPDAAAVLTSLGQPLAPPRLRIPTGDRYAPKTRPADAPSDTALILSLLALQPGNLSEPVANQARGWLQGLKAGRAATAADRRALADLTRRELVGMVTVSQLMQQRPDLFVADIANFYRMVREGTDAESRNAADALLRIVMSDPPGAHAAEGDAYLAALASRRNSGYLIKLVGRYDFDPVPVLRAELASAPRDRDPVVDLLQAACRADPRWYLALAPFVHELILPIAEDPLLWTYPGFSNPVDARTVGRTGTKVLLSMGREDLVQDLFTRADWEALRPAYQKTYLYSSREFSAEDMRGLFLGALTDIGNPNNPC